MDFKYLIVSKTNYDIIRPLNKFKILTKSHNFELI